MIAVIISNLHVPSHPHIVRNRLVGNLIMSIRVTIRITRSVDMCIRRSTRVRHVMSIRPNIMCACTP